MATDRGGHPPKPPVDIYEKMKGQRAGVDVVADPDLTYSAAFIWKPSSTLSEGITG